MMKHPTLDLERMASNLLRDEERAPTDLPEILRLARAVQQSDLWRRALAADECLVEVPFTIEVDVTPGRAVVPSDPAKRESRGTSQAGTDTVSTPPAPPVPLNPKSEIRNPKLLHGAIDLVFREGSTWTIVDYKSDDTTNRLDALIAFYAPQVRAYATLWQQMTNEPVRAGLFFIDGARTEWIEA